MSENNNRKEYDVSIEIELLIKRVSHFHDLSFKIKGWTITLWIGLIAAILTLEFETNNKGLLLIISSTLIISLFWFMDATYRIFQRNYFIRLNDIRDYFNKEGIYNPSLNKTKSQEKINKDNDNIPKERELKFITYDVNYSLSRVRTEAIMREYLRLRRLIRNLFARNIFPIYYWLICIGIYIGFFIEFFYELDVFLFTSIYISISSILFILIYIICMKSGLIPNKFSLTKSYNEYHGFTE